MPTSRYIFEVSTDTGTWGDTGGPVFGVLAQVRWVPATADTGGDLALGIMPRAGDTGDGWLLLDAADCLGAQFVKVPYQGTHDAAGIADVSDTGTPAVLVPTVFAGDSLRIKVTPGGAAVVGRLYVWTGSLA